MCGASKPHDHDSCEPCPFDPGQQCVSVDLQDRLESEAMGLIDAEYDVLKDFTKRDLWDYLKSYSPQIEKFTVIKIYKNVWGG